MSGPLELFALALRGVARNRRRTLITGVMIVLGVTAVIFSRGFIAGLQQIMTESMLDIRYGTFEVARGGYHESAELGRLDLDLEADGELARALAATPGVEAVSGRLRFVGMVVKGDESQVFSGLGVDPAAEARVCPKGPATRHTSVAEAGHRHQLVAGPGLGADDGVVLGIELAAAIDARVGDTVTLLAQTQSGSIDGVDARVVGLYRWDAVEDNRRGLVAPLALTQRLVHMEDRVTAFAIRAPEIATLERTQRALRSRLDAIDAQLELLTYRDLGPYLRDVMILQDRVMAIVMAVVFALLLAGVANTMLMSVFERTREIGTLMCLGMRRRKIVALFLVEGAALAAVAATAGVALGAALVGWAHRAGIGFFIPAVGSIINRPVLDPFYVALAFAAAVATALAAGLYPAWRASRLAPTTAVRA